MISELRLYQLLLVKLFYDLDKLLIKNDFKYYSIAGTLLGSFRHGGFIPWDTDIDICMLRDDYNDFIKFSKNNLPSNMTIDSFELNSRSKICFSRIRLKGTTVCEVGNVSSENSGFYIDIFPIDNFNKSEPSTLDNLILFIFKVMVRLKAFKSGKKHSSSFFRTFIGYFIGFVGFVVPLNILNSTLKSIMTRHNNKDTGYVTNYNSKYGLTKQTMSKDLYGKPVRIEFEGILINAPIQSFRWLDKIYGDWKLVPDVTKPYKLNSGYIYDFGNFSYLLHEDEIEVKEMLLSC